MCWKRCTDKKYLESQWYEEEIVFKYPDGSTRQIDQRCGEVGVGTIDFDENGNEMKFNSKDERTEWIGRGWRKEYERKERMTDPEYKPKSVLESVEIVKYQAEEMKLHTQVEYLEKIMIKMNANSMKWNEIAVKWEELDVVTWGYPVGEKEKKLHDISMAQIKKWEKVAENPLGADEHNEAIEKNKQNIQLLKTSLNIIEPPEGSPPIEEVYDFKGNKYKFASKHSKIWNTSKNNPDWKWCQKSRMKYFRWLQFQWTIKGKKFTAEELKTSLTTATDMRRI